MSKTSNEVKRRWNEKNYGRISAYVPKDLEKAFKEKCKADGISQAQVIKDAISDFLTK